jgi:hypothetical protein
MKMVIIVIIVTITTSTTVLSEHLIEIKIQKATTRVTLRAIEGRREGVCPRPSFLLVILVPLLSIKLTFSSFEAAAAFVGLTQYAVLKSVKGDDEEEEEQEQEE